MAFLIYLVSAIIIAVTFLYLSFKRSFRLWHSLNVPYIEPSFPFGNCKDIVNNRHLIYITRDLYEQLKRKCNYAGFYLFKWPVLFVTSPEFAKDILIRDFDAFVSRGFYLNRKDDPLTWNVFFVEGDDWRKLRMKLAPAFAPEKIKTMFNTIKVVGDELVNYVDEKGLSGTDVDIKDLMSRFTLDVISSCVFGLDGKSIKDPQSEFMTIGKKVVQVSKLKHFLTFLATAVGQQARQMGFRIFDHDTTEFFTNMVHDTIALRRENNYHRNDLMQILIGHLKLVEEDDAPDKLNIDEVVANCFVFFFAGFETSSTALTVALYHLAQNQEIQDRLRLEIKRILAKYENKFTYEGLDEMTYLEQVLSETLRLFPPIGALYRVANEEYKLPNGGVVPKGTHLMVPIYGIHHDADIYPEPEKFDPERFNVENKSQRHPFAYLPFGEGPRICIGARLASMQAKIALAKLLSCYRFQICDQTQSELVADNSSFTVVPQGSVWLKVEKAA